jgi:hypothetical protein
MKSLEGPAMPPDCRQLRLLFDSQRLAGWNPMDRDKARLALAHILMQAAGLIVEELGDDGH